MTALDAAERTDPAGGTGGSGPQGRRTVVTEVVTVPDLLMRAVERYGDAPALIVGEDHRTFTDLYGRAFAVARALVAVGVQPGDRVGLFVPNSALFVEALLGASLCGAVYVPLNTRFRTRELAHVVADAQLRVVITAVDAGGEIGFPARLAEALAEVADPPLVAEFGPDPQGWHESGEQFLARGAAVPPDTVTARSAGVRLRDVAAYLYTSGTTASPKGCIHTHEALVRNARHAGRTRFLLGEHDRFFDPLPMFHVGFLAPLLACLDAGTLLIGMPRFEGGAAVELIARHRATWLFPAFQALAVDLLARPEFPTAAAHVRMVMCTGNTVDLQALHRVIPGATLLNCYGSTETGGIVVYHEPDATEQERLTTSGTPFRGVEVRIVDPGTQDAVPVGETGEIAVRGFSVLDGYVNAGPSDPPCPDAEGWLFTGDGGALTDRGHVVFHGRLKDMLKVGGENVSPAEVEALLSEHPAVRSVQVVAAPHARLDEVVAAFVEVNPGHVTTQAEIVAFCTGRIASYKVPRHVRFVTTWPTSATKVDKGRLRQVIAAEIAAAGPEERP